MTCSKQGLALGKHEISRAQPWLTVKLTYVLFKMTSAGGFAGQQLACMRLSWWTRSVTHWPGPTEGATPTADLRANPGLWVIVVCQRRLTDCDKCPTLVGNIDSGGASVGVRRPGGCMYANSVLSAQFC